MSTFGALFVFVLLYIPSMVQSNKATTIGDRNYCFKLELDSISSYIDLDYHCFQYVVFKSFECDNNNKNIEFDRVVMTENEVTSCDHDETTPSGLYHRLILEVNNDECPDLDIEKVCNLINSATTTCGIQVEQTDHLHSDELGIVFEFSGDSAEFNLCLNRVNEVIVGDVAVNDIEDDETIFSDNYVSDVLPNFCVKSVAPTNDPTKDPTSDPTSYPTKDPSSDPTKDPTSPPTTSTTVLTADPTVNPSGAPTEPPTDPCEDFRQICNDPTQYFELIDGCDCDVSIDIEDEFSVLCDNIDEVCLNLFFAVAAKDSECETGDCRVNKVTRDKTAGYPDKYEVKTTSKDGKTTDTIKVDPSISQKETFQDDCNDKIDYHIAQDKDASVVTVTAFFNVQFTVNCCAGCKWTNEKEVSTTKTVQVSHVIYSSIVDIDKQPKEDGNKDIDEETRSKRAKKEWKEKICKKIQDALDAAKPAIDLEQYEDEAVRKAHLENKLYTNLLAGCDCEKIYGSKKDGSIEFC